MRRAVALLLLPLVAGCYMLLPLTIPAPAPGTKVSLVLNDRGRLDAAPQIGPYADRVQGSLLQSTDSDYLVSVTDVVDIRGVHNRWLGEAVPLRRSSLATTYERRLSKPRTIVLAMGVASAIVALIASRNLLGIGGAGDSGGIGGGNGQ
ncbi:MAG TPA: hypothetical protein VK124_00250 [Gemmatimonadales bacterium]|nr:hypothetical protein [Gemmatimonadales bacterium]